MIQSRLVIVFDVTGLSDDEIAGLQLEAVVQAEESERHPDVPARAFFLNDPIKVAAIDRDAEREYS